MHSVSRRMTYSSDVSAKCKVQSEKCTISGLPSSTCHPAIRHSVRILHFAFDILHFAFTSSVLLVLLTLALLPSCVPAADVQIKLARKDRLPDLPGATSSYEFNQLPSTETRFLLARRLSTRPLAGGLNAVDYWTCRWEMVPPGDAATDTGIAGVGNWGADASGAYAALLLSCPMPGGKPAVDRLFIFHDLTRVASYDLAERGMWITTVTSDGQVVCRCEKNPGTAYFYVPGRAPYTRTFPGLFLNWDAARGWAIYASERVITVTDFENRKVFTATLPFIVKKATSLEDGSIIVGSQSIGQNGGSWRVLYTSGGKRVSEAVFGDWAPLPSEFPQEDKPLVTGKRRRQNSPYLASFSEGTVEIRYKKSLAPADSCLASNAFHPFTCIDSRENIYTLMNRELPGDDTAVALSEQSVVRTHVFLPAGESPQTLLTGMDIAKEMGWKSAFLYAMTVSTDGDWLALTITPDDARNYTEWWVLQYHIIHPVPKKD